AQARAQGDGGAAALALGTLAALDDLENVGVITATQATHLRRALEEPMDLNRASAAELATMPQLSQEQAQALVAYRDARGPYRDLDHAQSVRGVDESTLMALAPYVVVRPVSEHWVVLRLGMLARRGGGRLPQQIDWLSETPTPAQGFVQLRVGDDDRVRAGVLVTYEELTRAHWDLARGQLVTHGPSRHVRVRHWYVERRSGSASWVAGSFDLGFGEGLTIGTGARSTPAWLSPVDDAETQPERARVRPRPCFSGVAGHWQQERATAQGLEATAFVGAPLRDLFQEDLRYGVDAAWGERACVEGCPEGYACDDGVCRSSALYDARDAERRYVDQTYEGAFREYLAGLQLGWRQGDRAWLGVVGFGAHNDLQLAREVGGGFARSASMPQAATFGAASVYGGWRAGRGEVRVEAGMSASGGGGFVARSRWQIGGDWQLQTDLRAYGAELENPHGHPPSAPGETQGLSNRNEMGTRVHVQGSPVSGSWLGVGVDAWSTPWRFAGQGAAARGGGRLRLGNARGGWLQLGFDGGAAAPEVEGEAQRSLEMVRQRWQARAVVLVNRRLERVGAAVTVRQSADSGEVLAWERPRIEADATLRPWREARVELLGMAVWPPIEGTRRQQQAQLSCRYVQRVGTHVSWRLGYTFVSYHEVRAWRFPRYHQLSLSAQLDV
ncbi:MAG: helix-hairpin-helix domain-containing protein, partial [Myxococcota bacterium]